MKSKSLGLSSNSSCGRECFSVDVEGKVNIFERGLLTMPDELSKKNYKQTYTALRKLGMGCKVKSASMSILGSTIGAACDDNIFVEDIGK